MIIKNFAQLAKTEERKLALEMIDAGLAAIDTQKIIKETISLGKKPKSKTGQRRYGLFGCDDESMG